LRPDPKISSKKEIEEWFKYQDQLQFNKKIDKQMRKEIERYLEGKKSIYDIFTSNPRSEGRRGFCLSKFFEKEDFQKICSIMNIDLNNLKNLFYKII